MSILIYFKIYYQRNNQTLFIICGKVYFYNQPKIHLGQEGDFCKNWLLKKLLFSTRYLYFQLSTSMSKLVKPQFVKIESLTDIRSGYNIYAKVVSVEISKSNDGKTQFARAVVADETGSADAFFKGEVLPLIKKGASIAIRNGKIRLIKNHISLEIDIFGRVTSENVEIKQNTKNNISEKIIERRERKPRRDYDNRKYDRQNDNNGYERRDRKPRDDKPREQRYQRQDRQPREEKPKDDRPHRQDRQPREDRKPRQQRETQQNRYPNQNRRFREERREDRGPRNNQEKGQRKPQIKWTKIGAIEPGDENLNITAQIVSVQPIGKRARVVLGDETGVVKAFLYNKTILTNGTSVVLFGAEASVVKQHIEITLMDRGRVDVARREVREVNKNFDVSAKEWIEQN